MLVDKIKVGKNPPKEVNVVIEVPAGSVPVKYEMDKESGALFVDRFLATPMHYPCNYGFIPQTLSDDGDPIDVLVVSEYAVVPGAVFKARPVGVLIMEDEKGKDEKIIAVPEPKSNSIYAHIQDYEELPELLRQQINHFFEHYKDLEKGKWVKVTGFANAQQAEKMIEEAIQRHNQSK